MNKRSAPRFPVTLDVDVTFPAADAQICTIRDYCSGGMYLLCQGQGEPANRARLGDRVSIEFEDQLTEASRRYHIEARVVRFEGQGVGVAFTEENARMLVALSQLAASQSAGGSGVAGSVVAGDTYGDKTVAQLISHIQARSQAYLDTILQEFFQKVPDALFDAAAEAKSNVQQSAYFGAINELRKGSEELRAVFEERFKAQFEVLLTPGFRSRYQQEAAAQGGLSLVGSDELDNWLAVRAISSKLEESLGETLEALETRLEEVSANPINLENNPVGPFLIISIFREMLNQLVLEEDSRKLLFSVMEAGLVEKLKALYDELNEAMIAQGILPTIQRMMEVVKKPDEEGGYATAGPPPTFNRQQEPGATTTPDTVGYDSASSTGTQEQKSPLHYTRGASSQPSSAAIPSNATAASSQPPSPSAKGTAAETTSLNGSRGASFRPSNSSIPTNATGASSQPPNRAATGTRGQTTQLNYSRVPSPQSATTASPANAATPAHAIHELVQLQPSVRAEGAGQLPPPSGYYSSDQLVHALDRIDQALVQHGRGQGNHIDRIGSLEQALSSAVGEEGMALSEGDKESIAYVGGMFSSIHEDTLVAEQARPWFSQLEVPLLKAGLLDDSLQDDETHPARELLNRLEAVGDLLHNNDSASAQEARERIETILHKVSSKVESEPDVFVDALKELTDVQESVEENYEENISKLIQQCEQEKVLDKARRTILDELNRRLGRQEVPLVVLNLLDSGWKNLLLRTLLKEGADSAAFQGYLNVIDRLAARLSGHATHLADAVMPDDELLEWIARMLKMVSSNEQRNEQLLDDIVAGLSADESTRVETRYVPALISKAVVAHQHKVDAFKPKEISDDVWSLMLEDARQPAEREVFLFRGGDTEGAQVNFIWQDEGRRFVFADNRGYKALDLELGEVASALYNKNLIRINEKELSVTERATYTFLQSLHNQITYQANHDSLTGLLNRKAFGQELEKVIDEAKSGKATHVLGYFDLDRFNLINTTCGHAEGDVLLGKVASVLAENAGEEETLARLGGDEFGIILRNTSRSSGLKQLTAIHDSIRNIHFGCENNEFKVTCSMGVSEINENSDTPSRLLSAVDSAAFTAKDNGRDNIQIYNTENQRISSRQDILGWVGRINVLFEKNLIKLRCQKITPLHKTINSLPHYEVLLDVQDEEGNRVPLEEFIVAAERYNRILDIDKWVVSYIFDWLEEHKSKLDRISNLSVNLSGVSLGNRHFIDELHERLSRPGFPAGKLCFEVTETIAMKDLDASARFMRKLKETGCLFALDDFGSGTSSYSYLRSLPLDYIKIDAAFITDIATNTDDYAVVKSINEIGHVMGKQTVAEGVENDFAYQLLHDIGIDFVQGFGVEKPIPLYRLFS